MTRNAPCRAALLLTLLGACAAPRPGAPPPLPVSLESTPNTVAFEANGERFCEVLLAQDRPVIVRSLRSAEGFEVLRPDPMDPRAQTRGATRHSEQRALWVAHGGVSGVNLWDRPEEIRLQSSEIRVETGGAISVRAQLIWFGPDRAHLVAEDRRLRFSAYEGERVLDVDLKLTAPSRGVVFGDTKDGFFALRLADAFSREASGSAAHAFTADLVEDGATELWGTRSRWCAVSAPVGPDGAPVTVAVLDHPENLHHPCGWQVRPYGLLAANPFGLSTFVGSNRATGAFELEAYGALRLRYRVLVLSGPADRARIDAHWVEWAG